MTNNSTYKQIIDYEQPTVIEEYISSKNYTNDLFESEQALEDKFINQLVKQGYEYLKLEANINHEEQLINNLRKQIENLNNIKFSDQEWSRLYNQYIANKETNSVVKRTEIIQNNYIYELALDNNKTKNIKLIDKDNIFNNYIQVINQFVNNDGKYKNRYDVTILINGLPLIHIELKRRGIHLKEAFNQIERYKNDSFWSRDGLFNYVQIFVISNGTSTKYYSNTTRYLHIKNQVYKSKTSSSYEFTNYWADAKNQIIDDLMDFTKTFFSKHTILNILTNYCIFTSDNKLIVMRPYQIVATERIINKVKMAINNKWLGSIDAGGYIWHTTGSGKTVTSFKTSQLIANMPTIDKVIFVVDRKDLDYQTMKEYDKFQKGSANSNSNIKILEQQLSKDTNKEKVIITTIQKLSHFIKKYHNHDIYNKNIVMIFDECHRSQFGKMHHDIVKNFKKYAIFGFTGTPIFAKNANITLTREIVKQLDKKNIVAKTTEQLFGTKLHTYTIVDAIRDNNVLQFKYDYVSTISDIKDDLIDEEVKKIYPESAWNASERIKNVTSFIIDNFNKYTYHNKDYGHNVIANTINVAKDKMNKTEYQYQSVNLKGFNSILAVSSVESAKLYYQEFKHQLKEKNIDLKIATIFSFSPNEEVKDYDDFILIDEENNESTSQLDESSRRFLDNAISDYNQMFGTNWDTSDEKFQSYYKDVSMRMKNKELDILIVVNMFLTGFDAPTLNTLWIDKWVKMHGLIQTFSRTNRILNSIKTCGQIVTFRPLKKRLDEAISLFSDNQATGIILLRSFNDYYYGYEYHNRYNKGYIDLLDILSNNFKPNKRLDKEEDKIEFIKLFSQFLQIRNILVSFKEFDEIKQKISERELQDYLSRYNDYYYELKKKYKAQAVNIDEDLVYECELVKQLDVNIDYLLNKLTEFHNNNIQDKEIIATMIKIIDSSYELRSKKQLILEFVESIKQDTELQSLAEIQNKFDQFYQTNKNDYLIKIINQYHLDKNKTLAFIDRCKNENEFIDYGNNINDLILEKPSRFSNYELRNKKINDVINALRAYYDTYIQIN